MSLLAALLLTATAPVPPGTFIDGAQALGTDGKRAALKLFTSLEARAPAAVSCGYGGQPRGSTGGVTLVIWSFDKAEVQASFAIYEPVADKAKCTPAAVSAERLAAAKAAFKAAGLTLGTGATAVPVQDSLQCAKHVEKQPQGACRSRIRTECSYLTTKLLDVSDDALCPDASPTQSHQLSFYRAAGGVWFADVHQTEQATARHATLVVSAPKQVPSATVAALQTQQLLDAVEVLAVDVPSKRAALRLSVSLNPDGDMGERYEAAACKYKGTPTGKEGTTLVLWDLAQEGATSVFPVYEPASDPAGCTPGAVSVQRLADAKAAFRAAGLDISAGPLKPLDAHAVRCDSVKKENDPEEGCGSVTTTTCQMRGVTVYEDIQTDSCGPFMRRASRVEYYQVGDAVVAVDRNHTDSMRGSWDALLVQGPARVPPAASQSPAK